MTIKSASTANRPAFRLGFAPRTGTDKNGQATLGYPVEIGACFHRADPDKGLIAKFTIIPADFRDGVLLLLPVRHEDDLLSEAHKDA